MRLIDIKRSINIAFENFHPKFSSNNTGIYYIDDIQKLKVAIRELNHIGFLHIKDSNDDLLAEINASITNRFILNAGQNEAYKTLFDKLSYSIVMLHQWINNYVTTEETEETINIKLPKINSIEDILKSCTIINKSLSLVVAEIGGNVTVKQFDYGSSWIIVSAGTGIAAGLIMTIAKTAFYLAKKYYGIKLMTREYERYKMANEMIKSLKETNEMIIKDELAKLAEEVEKKYYPESDNQRLGRIRVAIMEMHKLIELGGEVHPALILKESKDDKINYNELINLNKVVGMLPKNEKEQNAEQ